MPSRSPQGHRRPILLRRLLAGHVPVTQACDVERHKSEALQVAVRWGERRRQGARGDRGYGGDASNCSAAHLSHSACQVAIASVECQLKLCPSRSTPRSNAARALARIMSIEMIDVSVIALADQGMRLFRSAQTSIESASKDVSVVSKLKT